MTNKDFKIGQVVTLTKNDNNNGRRLSKGYSNKIVSIPSWRTDVVNIEDTVNGGQACIFITDLK